jgi:hypothetical protein
MNRRSAFVVALAADPRAVTVASVASLPKISFTCVADVLALSGATSRNHVRVDDDVVARARPPSSRLVRRSRSSNATSASMVVAIFRARRLLAPRSTAPSRATDRARRRFSLHAARARPFRRARVVTVCRASTSFEFRNHTHRRAAPPRPRTRRG